MTTRTLAQVGLRDYPFGTVAPTEPTDVWADRTDMRQMISQLARRWSVSPRSGIHLMWADFGAGKTHALRYVQHLCEDTTGLSAVYCDIAEQTKDFRSLFAQVTRRVPEDLLSRAINAHRNTHGASWLKASWLAGDRDTPTALWALATAPDQPLGDVARKWLYADRLSTRELSLLNVSSAIRRQDDAVRVLASICRLIHEALQVHAVLLLDEFQRIGMVSPRSLREVNAGIASVFNRCGEGLSILLSYTLANPEEIDRFVTPEVMTRVTSRLQLHRLNRTQVKTFVDDLISAHLRPEEQDVLPRDRVFSAEARESIIDRLLADSGGDVTPRRIMQAFGNVLDAALSLGAQFPISATAASRLYRRPDSDSI